MNKTQINQYLNKSGENTEEEYSKENSDFLEETTSRDRACKIDIDEIADLYSNQEQLYKRIIGIEIMPKKNAYDMDRLEKKIDSLVSCIRKTINIDKTE